MARERAKAALKDLGERVARHSDALGAHHDKYFDLARTAVTTGESPPGGWFKAAWSLTLECFDMTFQCVFPAPDPDANPGPNPDMNPNAGASRAAIGSVTLDGRSEMGGPVRFPALDGTSPTPAILRATATSGGVPINHAYARIHPNGDAWVSLVDLIDIDPTLPAGTHDVTIENARFVFARATLTEGKVLFGEGSIPAELANDPSLKLGDVLGTPNPPG